MLQSTNRLDDDPPAKLFVLWRMPSEYLLSKLQFVVNTHDVDGREDTKHTQGETSKSKHKPESMASDGICQPAPLTQPCRAAAVSCQCPRRGRSTDGSSKQPIKATHRPRAALSGLEQSLCSGQAAIWPILRRPVLRSTHLGLHADPNTLCIDSIKVTSRMLYYPTAMAIACWS